MKCPNCNREVGTFNFCPDCGTKIPRSSNDDYEKQVDEFFAALEAASQEDRDEFFRLIEADLNKKKQAKAAEASKTDYQKKVDEFFAELEAASKEDRDEFFRLVEQDLKKKKGQ